MKENPMLESLLFDDQDREDQSELEATDKVARDVAKAVEDAILDLRGTVDDISVRGIVSGALQGAISGVLSLAANPADPTRHFREPQAAFDYMQSLVADSGGWVEEVCSYWDAVASGVWGRGEARERGRDEEPEAVDANALIEAMIARGRQRFLGDDM